MIRNAPGGSFLFLPLGNCLYEFLCLTWKVEASKWFTAGQIAFLLLLNPGLDSTGWAQKSSFSWILVFTIGLHFMLSAGVRQPHFHFGTKSRRPSSCHQQHLSFSSPKSLWSLPFSTDFKNFFLQLKILSPSHNFQKFNFGPRKSKKKWRRHRTGEKMDQGNKFSSIGRPRRGIWITILFLFHLIHTEESEESKTEEWRESRMRALTRMRGCFLRCVGGDSEGGSYPARLVSTQGWRGRWVASGLSAAA